MDLLEKNINLLSKDTRHQIAPVSEEGLTFCFAGRQQETELFLDRKENPYAIKNQLDNNNLPDASKTELIVVLGLAGVEEIKQLIRLANPKSGILIIEPNPAFVLHSMQRKDLSFLNAAQVRLIAQPLEKLPDILTGILSSQLALLVANLRIYGTYYYRHYDLVTYKKLVHVLGTTIRYMLFVLGNDIEDSLIGLKNNLHNIRYMLASKDVSKLKNSLPKVPAIVVAAGPSLEKNIHYLRRAKGKSLIFAVDTIWQRLFKEGIVPDFICTIERPDKIYDYFYKNKQIPSGVILLAPPVVTPKIFANYQGDKIIPLRRGVREYLWLNDSVLKLNSDSFVAMGASVAHLAFGFAAHLGASPIVLVGQDLAYGEDGNRSHSSGTIYDGDSFGLKDKPKLEVDGYYGGKVLTQKTWVDFKMWFESEIMRRELFVINATEGGARITGSRQMPLVEVIERYCTKDIDIVCSLRPVPDYSLNLSQVQENLSTAQKEIEELLKNANKIRKRLAQIKLSKNMSEQRLAKMLAKMKKTDDVLHQIYGHDLLFHVLQPYVINVFHRFYKIPGILTYDYVMANLKLQQEFMEVVCKTIEMILDILQENVSELKNQK